MKRRFRSESLSQAPPVPNHAHYHQAGRGSEIAIKFLAGLLCLPIGWGAGYFLLWQMGIRDPGETLSRFLVIAVLGGGSLWLISRWIEGILDRRYEHRETMAQLANEALRYEQRMQTSLVADSRALGDEQRFVALVEAVMMKAYNYLAQHNTDIFPGNKRFWSRRQAGAITLHAIGDRSPVGPAMGSRVEPWLQEHEVIDAAGQIDLDRYPDLASIQRLLHLPITVRQQGRAPGSRPLGVGPGQMGGGDVHSIIDL